LLKNENKTLPIPADVKRIALIGPLADSKEDMLGFWSGAGEADKCVTLLEGLKNRTKGSVNVLTVKGCNINDENLDEISKAVSAARNADFVILALGESRMMSGEAACRTDISLPGMQLKLAEAVIKTGKPVVIVLFNGRPLAIPDLDKIAPAILETWFGGTEAGNGISGVLFGDYNPSGKLTMTFPLNVGQIPLFYNSKNTGRPINPDNPFGYGLSYTSFSYSDIKLNKESFGIKDKIIASVDISNTGERDGEEIAQLYVRDLVGDVTRPVKELKGFKKVNIRKGETITVAFTISTQDLAYYHQDMSFSVDPGDFVLFIGTNSEKTKNKAFAVK
jgi:beta-glucosidase